MIAVPKNCMKLYLELYGSCAPGLEPVLSIPQLPHTEPDQLGIARWYPGTLPVQAGQTQHNTLYMYGHIQIPCWQWQYCAQICVYMYLTQHVQTIK